MSEREGVVHADAGRPGGWRRWVTLGLVAAVAFVLCTFEETGFDLFYHMKAGEWMIERGAILRTDPFSHTRAGAPWITHEWGFEVLAALGYDAFGIEGLTVAKSLVAAAGVAVVAGIALAEGVPAAGVLLLGLATALLVSFRAMVRPHVFTFLALAVEIALVRRAARTDRSRPLFVLPPLFALWANVHGGVLFGLGFLGIFLAGRAIEERRTNPVGRGGSAWLVLALCALATLLNPNGYEAAAYPFRLLLHPEWTRGVHEYFSPFDAEFRGSVFVPVFVGMALLTVVGFALRRRPFPIADALLVVVFGSLAARSVRNVSDFGIVAAPILAAHIGRTASGTGVRLRDALRSRAATVGASLCVVACGAWASFGSIPLGPATASRFGLGFSDRVPFDAADFVDREGIRGNLFNSYGYGSFLDWRLWPATRVFLDGRNDVFWPVAEDYRRILYRAPGFEGLLDRYEIEIFFLEFPDWATVPPDLGTIHSFLIASPDWALVHWDDRALVYVRTEGRHAEVARRLGMQAFDPAARSGPLRGSEADARAELEGIVEREPGNALAARFLGDLLYRRREFDAALRRYEQALAERPRSSLVMFRLGHTYLALGRPNEAAAWLRRGLRVARGRGPEIDAARRALEECRRLGARGT